MVECVVVVRGVVRRFEWLPTGLLTLDKVGVREVVEPVVAQPAHVLAFKIVEQLDGILLRTPALQ